jgi:signal transduction histidine kinase
LYGIGLGARTAQHYLNVDPAQVREPLAYVVSLAEAGLAEMRALIFDLRMEGLDTEGLIAALERQAQSIQSRHGIQVQALYAGEPDLPLASKQEVYRILREALHNTVKHAQATRITLEFLGSAHELRVVIRDNGVGFDVQDTFAGHLGLHSMRERAGQLGGTLDIQSVPGQGTTIALTLPF